MARKPAHFTQHTNEETHLRVKAALSQLGMSVDAREDKLNDITVDGVRIGDRLAEMRKPGTTFYGQTYIEARSAAMLMVNLCVEQLVLDVRRLDPPAPDIEVRFRDGTSIFVEQTMVMDDGARRLSMAVDNANAAVMATADSAVLTALDAGLLTIRLDRLTTAHLDLEVLLMDDDSRDGSAERVAALGLPWFRLITRTTDRGLSFAVLDGLERSQREFLVDRKVGGVFDGDQPLGRGNLLHQSVQEGGLAAGGAAGDDDVLPRPHRRSQKAGDITALQQGV